MKEHIAKFLKNHNISNGDLSSYEYEAINLLVSSQKQIENPKFMDKYDNDWIWEISLLMLGRNYEYVASSIVQYLAKLYAPAEIVARTSIESSVNLIYIFDGDPLERIVRYLSAYVASERRQNKLWNKTSSEWGKNERKIYPPVIQQKQLMIDSYEEFMRKFAGSVNIPYEPEARWPSVFDRFRDVDKEVAYRTVYSSLSSQVHGDAEDLINRIITFTFSPSEISKLAQYQISFSLKSVFSAITYYIDASIQIASHFEMVDELTWLVGALERSFSMFEKLPSQIR